MRKGFTLVEILIVIIVMSILGAMMTYSSSEAISSNKAAEIVIKLRNLKIAAMQMYVDKLDTWEKSTSSSEFTVKNVAEKYLNDDKGYKDDDEDNTNDAFVLVTDDASKPYAERNWYAACNIENYVAKDSDKVKEKLVKRKDTDELLGFNTALVNNGICTPIDPYNGSSVVLLRIRKAN